MNLSDEDLEKLARTIIFMTAANHAAGGGQPPPGAPAPNPPQQPPQGLPTQITVNVIHCMYDATGKVVPIPLDPNVSAFPIDVRSSVNRPVILQSLPSS